MRADAETGVQTGAVQTKGVQTMPVRCSELPPPRENKRRWGPVFFEFRDDIAETFAAAGTSPTSRAEAHRSIVRRAVAATEGARSFARIVGVAGIVFALAVALSMRRTIKATA